MIRCFLAWMLISHLRWKAGNHGKTSIHTTLSLLGLAGKGIILPLHLPDLHSGSGNIVLPGSMDSLYYAGNNSTIPKYNFKNMTIWKWHDLFRIKTNKITILCTFFNLKFTPTTFTSIPLKLFIKMANNSNKWQQIALNCNKKLIENVIK